MCLNCLSFLSISFHPCAFIWRVKKVGYFTILDSSNLLCCDIEMLFWFFLVSDKYENIGNMESVSYPQNCFNVYIQESIYPLSFPICEVLIYNATGAVPLPTSRQRWKLCLFLKGSNAMEMVIATFDFQPEFGEHKEESVRICLWNTYNRKVE